MRWGLIGTGPWARSVHAPSLSSHANADLTRVWGRDAVKTRELAREHAAEPAETFSGLLEEVEAVSFAIAPGAQATLALQAAARGRHLLLEKPLATDPDEVARFAASVPEETRAAVFLTRLFEPARSAWLREVSAGSFDFAHVEWVSSALTPGSVYADSAWRRDATGIIWDLMPHVLSQLSPVLGEVTEAEVEPWAEREGVLVRLRHAGGATSLVRMTLRAQPEERAEWIRFEGDDGESLSPQAPLDFVAAHRAAISALDEGTQLDADPLLRWATPSAAVGATAVMARLAAQWRGSTS